MPSLWGANVDDALLDVVLARLDAKPLREDAASLLLAAFDGEAALAAQLSGDSGLTAEKRPTGPAAEPAGAYLHSISVSGFRGVGPAAKLDLEPGPGLTLVVGRNGSGKSSFAEGLEVLLTGALRRWQEMPVVWQGAWRNMHASDPARITAEFLVEDAGPTAVERTWAAGADFADSRVTVQVVREKQTDLDRLGWRELLATYRPFLSHAELEAFFTGPSRLYDLLASVLGLEELTAAEKRLAAARKERKARLDDAEKDLPALLGRLDLTDDERAASCREALAARKRDIERALAIAAGGSPAHADGELSRLRQLGQLAVPSRELAEQAVAALRTAADALDETAGSRAGEARELAALLDSALRHHRTHGRGACPVCGQADVLDDAWRDRTEREVARLRGLASAAQEAHDRADAARSAARGLLQPVPAILAGTPAGSADLERARAAWEAWATHPGADERRLADHIEQAWPLLHEAVTALAVAVGAELRAREDRWAPVAAEVATWCREAREAEVAARPLAALQAAITWLKGATDDIRNARLAPLGDEAREIWALLRQESNVDLGAIRLSGAGPRRQVDLSVTVDGAPGAALGVMSQGEVNALALSIFLPRATMPGSPFRFLVIDDPVQAMDPAKVEGLARVLEAVARSRQVLVFTHDDRLPEAVRRLGIPARILEVARRPGSVVEVRPALTPVGRLLKDAGAACADPHLPEDVAARVIPGICRLAVEAAFTEAIRRRQFRAGRRHAEIEKEIDDADTTGKRAALALFGDAARVGEVRDHLRTWDRESAAAYQAVTRGAHTGHRGPLSDLIGQTRRLTDTIGARLR
jgi:recombinational DNA repair ATPase RecF